MRWPGIDSWWIGRRASGWVRDVRRAPTGCCPDPGTPKVLSRDGHPGVRAAFQELAAAGVRRPRERPRSPRPRRARPRPAWRQRGRTRTATGRRRTRPGRDGSGRRRGGSRPACGRRSRGAPPWGRPTGHLAPTLPRQTDQPGRPNPPPPRPDRRIDEPTTATTSTELSPQAGCSALGQRHSCLDYRWNATVISTRADGAECLTTCAVHAPGPWPASALRKTAQRICRL